MYDYLNTIQPEELEDKPRRSLADLLGLRRKEGDNGAEE